MVQQKAVYGAFVLLITVAYISYITATPFPNDYKMILYIPSLILFAVFLLIATKRGDEEEATGGYFDY